MTNNNEPTISISGEWAPFFMYLCATADKAWQSGLAGAAVAAQLCQQLEIPYQRHSALAAVDHHIFARMPLRVDFREINELAKFSMWRPAALECARFRFVDDQHHQSHLNESRIRELTERLLEWRQTDRRIGAHIPEEWTDVYLLSPNGGQN